MTRNYGDGEYIPVKKTIPDTLYVQTLSMIRSEAYLKRRRAEILEESPSPPDGLPRGSGTSDPTALKAEKLAEIDRRLSAIEKGFDVVPEEFRNGVKQWIKKKGRGVNWIIRRYDVPCSSSTLSRYRIKYIEEVARLSGITL